MKENNFTEKESLELISQMIQQSKKNMEIGSGNILFCYGYPAVILAMVIYLLVHMTHNPAWSALWFLMFVPSIWVNLAKKKSKPRVVTHVDKAITGTWSILGWLFFLSVIGIWAIGAITGNCNFALMLPLSLLYTGVGISVTGIITDFKLMIYTPVAAFLVAIYMLVSLVADASVADWWNLLFGASFLIMMIIPGHLLNYKAKEPC